MGKMEDLAKALMSAVGGNDAEPEIRGYLHSGYHPLNKIISGDYDLGWPFARIAEVYGPSASGKTVIATNAMAQAQKAGGIGIFVDWERTFNGAFARRFDLDTTFPKFIYKLSRTWEEGNTVIMKSAETIRKSGIIAPEAPICAVLDSIAAAVPKSMLCDKDGKERGIEEFSMNDTTALARVTSTTLKVINQYVAEFNMVVIYLNQIRTKPGVVYGDPTTTPGGGATEFYCTTRLCTGVSKVTEKVAGKDTFVGREIGVINKKSKITMPFQKTDMRMIYDDDGVARFDYTYSMIDHLVDLGKLAKDGNKVVWDGKSYYKKALAAAIDKAGAQSALIALLKS